MFYIAYELEKIYDNIKIYIEEYFNQLKHYIKLDKPLEFKDIKRCIEKSINNIKINNYNNYFLHSFDIRQLIKQKEKNLKYIFKNRRLNSEPL